MELTLDDEGTHTLFGNHDENLRLLEDAFDVKISSRGNEIFVTGAEKNVATAQKLLAQMQQLIEQGYPLKMSDISTGVRVLRDRPEVNLVDFFTDDAVFIGPKAGEIGRLRRASNGRHHRLDVRQCAPRDEFAQARRIGANQPLRQPDGVDHDGAMHGDGIG